jgi:tol-pal system protein YbgF
MQMRAALPAIAALLVAACATTPKEDPVLLRLDDLDARVGRIDRIVSNNSLVQLAQQIEAQQQELRQLRGRIDELQNENTKLRQEQRDLYSDLDRRISEARAIAATAPPPANPGDEQALYNRALELLRTRDYAAAVDSLRSLVAAYPNGQLADNTQYWLGEAYYVTREWDHAAAAFQRVLTVWPESAKAPDALLKLAYTQLEQGNTTAGRTNLQQVVTRYPGTDAARLASQRLAGLPRQ